MYLNLINYPFGVDWTTNGERFVSLTFLRFGFRSNSLVSVYINTTDNMVLGAWHVFPRTRRLEMLTEKFTVNDKDSSKNLIYAQIVYLYFHGNAGNRATAHRTSFYKVLDLLIIDAYFTASLPCSSNRLSWFR
jgi:abhydrolase domain-containing protein 12